MSALNLPWERPISYEVKNFAHLTINDLSDNDLAGFMSMLAMNDYDGDDPSGSVEHYDQTIRNEARARFFKTAFSKFERNLNVSSAINQMVSLDGNYVIQQYLRSFTPQPGVDEQYALLVSPWRMQSAVEMEEVIMVAHIVSDRMSETATLGDVAVLVARCRRYAVSLMRGIEVPAAPADVMSEALITPTAWGWFRRGTDPSQDVWSMNKRTSMILCEFLEEKVAALEDQTCDALFWFWVATELFSDVVLRDSTDAALEELVDQIMEARAVGMETVIRCMSAGITDVSLMASAEKHDIDLDLLRAVG